MAGDKIFSLSEVAGSIQKSIAQRYQSVFWVRAEMNKLSFYKQSGHCYPELLEKVDGRIIAQMKAVIWKDDYRRINENFHKILREPLKDGIKILFPAKICFDPVFGLSLRILDIDPSYTLGDLEREKNETIHRLHEEAVFYLNKQMPFPLLPQRLAIISVDASKGYADFVKVLGENAWKYKFEITLFAALLQGDRAPGTIIAQLDNIHKRKSEFDAVAIIRGGGGDAGLTCYNNYELSKAIALFPLPVITGIGHATNETIAEMVSFATGITPTKIAEFLIQKFHNFSVPLKRAEDVIRRNAKSICAHQRETLQNVLRAFQFACGNIFSAERKATGLLEQQYQTQASILLAKTQSITDAAEKTLHNLDPRNVLKRGYSITLFNGKPLMNASAVATGNAVRTILAVGELESEIRKSDCHENIL